MKKIINGKRYDTDTARLIGSTGYSYAGNSAYWLEELYLKKKLANSSSMGKEGREANTPAEPDKTSALVDGKSVPFRRKKPASGQKNI